MKYCLNCKKIFFTDDKHCECGTKLIAKPDFDYPVSVSVVSGVDKDIVRSTLDNSKIPYSLQTVREKGLSVTVPGLETDSFDFLVPLKFYKKAIDALVGVSAIKEPDYYDKLDLPEAPEWEDMPSGKQTAIRIASAIGFIVIVWLCVAGVDLLAELLMGIFK